MSGARIASIIEKILVRQKQEWHFRHRTIGSVQTGNARKVGEVKMAEIVQFNVLDVALLFFNIILILIRLHFLEKKVKELEGR